ncbi:Hypothetical protein FKW44_009433 [Caligus rogercresseyi]|uniref:Uncharacterized protein n=1 Tax=Caligus rogercresseyi TaxID=217165 RepID=A0A7T8HFK9_CALRO|nr:Hypothetical protein FKW44_009433 [Caligus rogercresseyi]
MRDSNNASRRKGIRLKFIHAEFPRTHLICCLFQSQVILRGTGSQYLQPKSVEWFIMEVFFLPELGSA